MKIDRQLLIALLLLVTACKGGDQAPQQVQQQTFLQQPVAEQQKSATQASPAKTVRQYELPAPLKNRPEIMLKRTGYTVSYNRETRCPNWVAWHLTKAHTYGSNQRDEEVFTEDSSVPAPRATDNDYYNSRYDRGHMCPAGDNKWDATAMSETFLFTNICPQNHGLNKYEWNDVEKLCRQWAKKYGAVDIVCGPLYDGRVEPRYIGRNKVRVPDAFFKAVLCRKESPKAIAFVFRNQGKKMTMLEAVRTVDEVERMTGFDLFPQMDDVTEQRIEAEADLENW